MARDAAAKLGAIHRSPVRRIVVIYFTDTQYGLATYGQTRELCAEAKAMGEALFKHVERAVGAAIDERSE